MRRQAATLSASLLCAVVAHILPFSSAKIHGGTARANKTEVVSKEKDLLIALSTGQATHLAWLQGTPDPKFRCADHKVTERIAVGGDQTGISLRFAYAEHDESDLQKPKLKIVKASFTVHQGGSRPPADLDDQAASPPPESAAKHDHHGPEHRRLNAPAPPQEHDGLSVSLVGAPLEIIHGGHVEAEVFHQCRKEGVYNVELVLETELKAFCISWQKICEPTWGDLEVIAASSFTAVVQNGVVLNEWWKKAGAFTQPQGQHAFILKTVDSYLRIETPVVTTNHSRVSAALIDPPQPGEVIALPPNDQSNQVQFAVTCPHDLDEPLNVEVKMKIPNFAPITPPLEITWPIVCLGSEKRPSFDIYLGQCYMEHGENIKSINSTVAAPHDSVLAVKKGQVLPEFSPNGKVLHTVGAETKCQYLTVLVPNSGPDPVFRPPAMNYNEDRLHIDAGHGVPIRKTHGANHHAHVFTLKYICLDDLPTKVKIALHMKDLATTEVAWQKLCSKPKSRVSPHETTAKTGFVVLGAGVAAIFGLFYFTPLGRCLFSRGSRGGPADLSEAAALSPSQAVDDSVQIHT